MEATQAYEEIKSGIIGDPSNMTIIILDIQMPVMNGFQFTEVFEQLPIEIQSKFAIFLFSSSINENDKNRLGNFPSIIRFYSKPISKDTVAQMIEQI